MRSEHLNKKYIAIIISCIIASYLPYFRNTFGIDTEYMILDSERQINSWLTIHRYGLVALSHLFSPYNNLIVPFVVVALLCLSGILFFYILEKKEPHKQSLHRLIFVIIFICNPFMYAQFYFKLQAIPVALCFFLIMVACFLFEKSFKFSVLIASLIFALSFSVYQTFLFFTISLMLFFICIGKGNRKVVFFQWFISIGIGGVLYLLGLFYFSAPTLTLGNGYGTHFINWGSGDLISQTISGGMFGIVLGVSYLLLIIAIFVVAILSIRKKDTETFLLVLFGASFLIAPLLFGNLLLPSRMIFATFSIVFGGLVYIIASRFPKYKFVYIAIAVLLMAMTSLQIVRANMSYESDKRLVAEIVLSLNEAGVSEQDFPDYYLYFIGNYRENDRSLMERALNILLIGNTQLSFFQFDHYSITGRPYRFLATQGYHFGVPSSEGRSAVNSTFYFLPNFPEEDSIFIDGNMIVIKLSD